MSNHQQHPTRHPHDSIVGRLANPERYVRQTPLMTAVGIAGTIVFAGFLGYSYYSTKFGENRPELVRERQLASRSTYEAEDPSNESSTKTFSQVLKEMEGKENRKSQ